MDVLNNIAVPQSTEHVHLLLFIFNLMMAVLVPYLALMSGAVVLAVWSDRRGRKGTDMYGVRFARDLVLAVIPTKTVFTFLGLIPALSLVFVFAQILQESAAASATLAALGVLFLIAGGVAAFSYRYTFQLEQALSSIPVPASEPGEGLADLRAGAETTHRKSGMVAAVTLLITTFCMTAAVTVAAQPESWSRVGSLFAAVLDGPIWLAWLMFLAVTAAVTGSAILFFRTRDDTPGRRQAEPGYEHYVRSRAIRILVAALLVAPLLLVVNLVVLPPVALSGGVFFLAGAGILLFFLALHFAYAFSVSERAVYPAFAFASVVLATVVFVSKDQVVLHNATQDHALVLAQRYTKEAEALKSSLGIAAKQLTGEDIFNAKCSACHMFDQKKVGPPYASVLPKYSGKKSQLIAFILNPGKVDPAYPSMPSQGLKPSEADSIATYLMEKVHVKGS